MGLINFICYLLLLHLGSTASVWKIIHGDQHEKSAHELRRYIFLLGNHKIIHFAELFLSKDASLSLEEEEGYTVFVGDKYDKWISMYAELLGNDYDLIQRLQPQEYFLSTRQFGRRRIIFCVGTTKAETSYAAYSLLEILGVRFYLSGDIYQVLEDFKIPVIPTEVLAATFDNRGLQPFHDFAEGPDWWTADHYKMVISQLEKQKMNFIGLHTYPYSGNPMDTGTNEPEVWLGPPNALNSDNTINYSYPTSWASTLNPEWGMTPLPTSNFTFGANLLFDQDCWGSSVQTGNCPVPTTPEGNNQVFDNAGVLLADAFEYAHARDVQTCVGTEVPLTKTPVQGVPIPLKLYWSESRHDHFLTTTDCAACEGEYTFVRVEGYVSLQPFPGSVPLNTYYSDVLQDNWLTLSQPSGYRFVRTEGYATNLSSSPTTNQTTLFLYYNSNISDHYSTGTTDGQNDAQATGYTFIEKDAYVLITGPTPSAQDYYETTFKRIMKTYDIDYYWLWTPEGWEWDELNSTNPAFTQAVDDLNSALAASTAVNATFKLATCGWVLGPLPDRTIFDQVLSTDFDFISSIDMDVGNTPVDPAYGQVTNHKKWDIPWMEDDPGLSAPELWVNRTLLHMEDAAKYGCQGLLGIHWRTGVTSPTISAMAQKSWNATLKSADFWQDWASSNFGSNMASVGAIFDSIDSFNLPRPAQWLTGPGNLYPEAAQCDNYKNDYGFITQLLAVQNQVIGALNQDRYSYWLANFNLMQQEANFDCNWYQYNQAIQQVRDASADQQQKLAETVALPARTQLIKVATSLMNYLLSSVTNYGEFGTVRNILTHSFPEAITDPTAELEKFLGYPLPATAQPPTTYSDQLLPRIVVPTVRADITKDEKMFSLTTMILLSGSVQKVIFYWRVLGTTNNFTPISFQQSGTQGFVYKVSVPSPLTDFEYYIEADVSAGILHWPPTAPNITQTVIVV